MDTILSCNDVLVEQLKTAVNDEDEHGMCDCGFCCFVNPFWISMHLVRMLSCIIWVTYF